VLIADHHTLLRQSLSAALSRVHTLRVVAEAWTASEALQLARSRRPEVIVIDTDLPGGGVALIAQLLREAPNAAIVILTNDNTASANQMLQVGARGYLDKNCELRDVARAIERVRLGDTVVMAGPAHTVIQPRHEEDSPVIPIDPEPALTSRELEVVNLVVQGHTNSQIADRLCITSHTVKGHLAKILTKLELDNRVQLTAYAARQGLAQLMREPVRATPRLVPEPLRPMRSLTTRI
jgi:DNA-binding NarL/FixJ family response regulator